MAGEVGEPAELGGSVQVTLLSKARVFGLTPPVLAWGQQEGVRTPVLRGCPLSPVLVFSLCPLGQLWSVSSGHPVPPSAGSPVRAGVLLPPGLPASLPC